MTLQRRSRVSSVSKQSRALQKEVKLLRSFMIGVVGRDAEGSYRPEFVKRILATVNEKSPHHFNNTKSFLNDLLSS